MLVRAGSLARALIPSATAGAVLLAAALVLAAPTLGAALGLGGGTYVAFLVAHHAAVDSTAPIVAVLLLLCGELTAWSLDERWRIRADRELTLRRAGAVALLVLGGLAAGLVVVALAAVPPSHGVLLTFAGAAAAVGAAGAGIVLARR